MPTRQREAEDTGYAVCDMAPLIERMRVQLAAIASTAITYELSAEMVGRLRGRFGFLPRGQSRAEILLASDVAFELGHPSTASLSAVLLTQRVGLVRSGCITRVGPDLNALSPGERRPFGQIVLLAVSPETSSDAWPDPFDIDRTQYLTRRLPGYVVRTVPGRLWARVSKRARQAGLGLEALGAALRSAYGDDFAAVVAVESLFVTSSASDVESLRPIATEAATMASGHRRRVLQQNDDMLCEDLSCETCDDRAVCDGLRDVAAKRNSRRRVRP